MYIEYFNTKCSFCNEEDEDCILYSEESLYSNKTFIFIRVGVYFNPNLF